MIALRTRILNWLAGGAVMALLGLGITTQALAENLKIEARLIWGTNDEKSPNEKHKPVDEVTAAKLRKVFKWKNYFEEKREVVDVPSREMKKVTMSPHCELEIRELQGAPIEVKLVGKGKLVNKTTKPLSRGELFIIAGDDKDGCAWFVILNQLDK